MKKEALKNWCLRHREALLLLGGLGVYLLAVLVLGIPCPIKYVTGISCPGCGMTRALMSLARLELTEAMVYHPLCLALLPVGVGLILLRVFKRDVGFQILLYVSVGVMLAVYLYRLLFLQGEVVVAQPENGLIGRMIRGIIHAFSG